MLGKGIRFHDTATFACFRCNGTDGFLGSTCLTFNKNLSSFLIDKIFKGESLGTSPTNDSRRHLVVGGYTEFIGSMKIKLFFPTHSFTNRNDIYYARHSICFQAQNIVLVCFSSRQYIAAPKFRLIGLTLISRFKTDERNST